MIRTSSSLFVIDDLDQSARARALVAASPLFLATSVSLEAEWVLRERVAAEDGAHAMQAFDGVDAGMDFADALHLAGSKACEAFASFERRLAKVSKRLGVLPVVEP